MGTSRWAGVAFMLTSTVLSPQDHEMPMMASRALECSERFEKLMGVDISICEPSIEHIWSDGRVDTARKL
jgi:hypothetical protein